MDKRTVPSDIEKTNLEAHVIICSDRYDNLTDNVQELHTRLDKITEDNAQKTDELNQSIQDVKESVVSDLREVNKTIADVKDNVNDSINEVKDDLTKSIQSVQDSIVKDKDLLKDNLIKWGFSIIISLFGFVGSLLWKYLPLIEKLAQNLKK